MSRRYYTRETSGRASPFAVPYNGEEVKLHWANADQYYVKSTEYFSNFTFDLRVTDEDIERKRNLFKDESLSSLMVHFRIVNATEGEHGNVKASDANKRVFILYGENPIEYTDDGELVIYFEYRADSEKSTTHNEATVAIVLERLKSMVDGNVGNERLRDYHRIFATNISTDKKKTRTVLAKYVDQYTSRNTMDYFIHKDLGGFLHRELDFYIKNEVMYLDDVEHADVPSVESYLRKIKVIRQIAGKLIDFLAQLENFQRRLWLKKKFVVETNYCITLDRIPEAFYGEIASNAAQREEWIRLFAIDEITSVIEQDKATIYLAPELVYSNPLTVSFLKSNPFLVLDTKFFSAEFKARLLASIENFDEQCDGLLIHSDNFQALNLLQARYREQVKCVYIDPPYNTGGDGFIYKDSYQHSSWLSLMNDRLQESRYIMSNDGVIFISIDDNEVARLRQLCDNVFGDENFVACLPTVMNLKGNNDQYGFAGTHEYTLVCAKDYNSSLLNFIPVDKNDIENWEIDEFGLYKQGASLKSTGVNAPRSKRPNLFFPVYISRDKQLFLERRTNDDIELLPMTDGQEMSWRWSKEKFLNEPHNIIIRGDYPNFVIYKKTRSLDSEKPTQKPKSLFYKPEYSSGNGTNEQKSFFGNKIFSNPKPVILICDFVTIGAKKSSIILDYFAGSGTTGHAVIQLNREDGGRRKYILVEMGDYFDTVLKPRIEKVIYADVWKDGKPVRGTPGTITIPPPKTTLNGIPVEQQTLLSEEIEKKFQNGEITSSNIKAQDPIITPNPDFQPENPYHGISHCFKYIRLESYEDTLNNLRFDENPVRTKVMANQPSLREDYTLHYMLDVETRGSQSLLNLDAFADPMAYTLNVKIPGSNAYESRAIDLIETFHYLIGLRVTHIATPQTFTAEFKRTVDPDLPNDQQTKLVLDGRMRQDENGSWWFRKVEGWIPQNIAAPDGSRERVLIIWRKLTGNIERDNLMLDEWFLKNRINPRDFEFDTIYVNGDNNLPNLKLDDEHWKVRLIEEVFMNRMWNDENV